MPTLHPTLRDLLDADEAAPPLDLSTLDAGRAAFDAMAAAADIPGPQMRRVEDRHAPAEGGQVALRVYVPHTALREKAPMVVFFHGGGWVFGGLDSHDSMCRRLAHHSGAVFVSVAYRLSPEHQYPTPLLDALAGYRWALTHAQEFGAGANVALAGDSAGGNIALSLALHLCERGLKTPDYLLLFYPVTDLRGQTSSRRRFARGYWLDNIDVQTASYLGRADKASEPLASPILHPLLNKLPRTRIVTAGFDPLYDEGVALGTTLSSLGVPVETVNHADMLHGFLSLPALLPEVEHWLAANGKALGAAISSDRGDTDLGA